MRKVTVVVVMTLLCLVVACGPSGVSQEEYDSVASELATAQQGVTNLESKLAAAQQQVADGQAKLASAEQQVADLQSQLDQLVSDLSSAQQRVTDLETQLADVPPELQHELQQLQQEHDQAAEVQAMLDEWAAAWGALKPEKVASFYTEDCSYLCPLFDLNGSDEVRDAVQALVDQTQQIEIKSVFGTRSWGAAEAIWTTLDRGGRIAKVPYCAILQFQDGKISRELVYYDTWPLRK
ncbi:MAG: hypothetical protein AMJ93_15215 [Anaerolineae bacterium SM23_84]|nr:MAG: hypothetical protein AMJ93_15215 [Anaerolineae bacterium SM23_84]